MTETVKPLFIYHGNCTDGFGSNFFAHKFFHDKYKVPLSDIIAIPADYKREDQILDKIRNGGRGRDVFIMDFSFSPEIIRKEIAPISYRVTLLDHHKTAMEQWTDKDELYLQEDNITVKFDMHRSGTLLTWEYFFASEPYNGEEEDHAIASYISDWDLFKFEYGEKTKQFNAFVRSLPMTLEGWKPVTTHSLVSILKEGQTIKGAMDNLVHREAKSSAVQPIAFEVDGKIVKGLSLNTSANFSSEVGQILAQKCGTYAVIWRTDGITAFCSLRSIEGFNCSEIAAQFGGGGHVKASGCSMPIETLISAIKHGISNL